MYMGPRGAFTGSAVGGSISQRFSLNRKEEVTMDEVRELERSRIKSFYRLLVDRLGAQTWEKRKTCYEARIREKEATLDTALPIEP